MKFFTKRRILSIILIVVLAIFVFTPEEKYPQSHFSHAELLKISPDGVIDPFTIRSPEGFDAFGSKLVANMVKRGILLEHPMFGAVFQADNPNPGSITLVIQSPGGLVSVGNRIAQMLESFRANNIHIDCVVSEAQSMAFFIVVTQCDRVYAKKNVKFMQHKVHYGQQGTNSPSTFVSDLEMARKEAEVLGVDFNKWFKLTRLKEEDHVFTQKEIRDYKLVDGWVD